jgi:RNA polymerase sigma factor (sigma-70 family)
MSQVSEFERLARACHGELFAVVLARCGNRESAKDLLQEVLLAAWRNRETLLALSAEDRRRYLFAIARNRAIDHARRKSRQSVAVLNIAEGDEPAAPSSVSMDERIGMLDQCMNCLPPDDRELLMLSTLGELDSQAIADRLGSIPSTIRSRLSRIRQQLRNCITAKMERPTHVG